MMDRTYKESIIAAVLIFAIVIVIATAIVIFAAPAPKACAYQLNRLPADLDAKLRELRERSE